jgi:hypothetical protein
MIKFERMYGDRADLFRAIPARISLLNKLPIQRIAVMLTSVPRSIELPT